MLDATYIYDVGERELLHATDAGYDDADTPPYFWNYEFRFDLRDATLAQRYEIRAWWQ